MSRILRRPMFRGGRVEDKGDLKVVDKMGIAKLANGGMAQRPGYDAGDIVKSYQETLEQLPMPEKRERRPLSTGDYLRIASSGLDILGAPSEGSGIGGALRSAAGPLSKLGVGLGESIDARALADEKAFKEALKERSELGATLTGAGVELDIAKIKSKGQLEVKKEYLDKVYEAKRKGKTEAELIDIEKSYQKDFDLFIVKGFDLSDLARLGSGDEVQRRSYRAAEKELKQTVNEKTGNKWTEDDVGYQIKLINLAGSYVSLFTEAVTSSFAEGGLAEVSDVNVETATPTGMTDVNVEQVTEDPASQDQPVQISYDELRARLPKEIGDDIINLLANSYEALADFSQIQTQADIDTFNVKYGVELVLPQEV